MKIKYIYLLSFVVSVLSLASCNSALDLAPAGMVSMDQVFSDNNKVEAFLNTCYANAPQKGIHYFFAARGPVCWSDEAWDCDDRAVWWAASAMLYNGNTHIGFDAIDDQSNQDGTTDYNYWSRYWQSIHNCSIFLSRIKTATVNNESDRNRWTAEVHLLRAYYYSELLKWYGCALPLEKEPYALKQDFGKTKRASYYEVTKFIIQDCDSALNVSDNDLPWRLTTNNDAGRVSKALAEAIKSRMSLFAASPLYNDGNNYWAEAYDINKASLANLRAHGYQLYKTIHYPQIYLSSDAFLPNKEAALYNEYFCTPMVYTNPIDQETIFQSKDGGDPTWLYDGVGAQHQYKTGTCPSQELVDSYETTDGQPILDLSNPYLDEQHTQPNYNSNNKLYDSNKPYENRDPRFYASIYYNGSKRKAQWNFNETPECIENYPASMGNRVRTIATWDGEPQTGISQDSRTATRTGYYERKFVHPFAGDDYGVDGANAKLFRLGEVILNFAESAAMAGGHDQEAIDAVNEIRTRVGMPNLPSGISHEDLILRIKHERRVELAMEENRYFDVRRWSKPTEDLSKTDKWVTAMDITRNADGTFTYTRRPVRSLERKCYESKYLKLPINEDEANLMQSITGEKWQNPGW